MSAQIDQISSTLDRLAEAWKANDAAAVASLFTDDGSLINPFGQRADGRAAVAGMYEEYFAGMLKATSTTIDVRHVRAVNDDYAFVDTEQQILGPDGLIVLAVHLTALFRQEEGRWLIADGRAYAFAPVAQV